MNNSAPYKGILFDFDGVLARTMEDNLRAWQKAFGDAGGQITGEEYFPLEGMRPIDVAVFFCDKNGIPETRAEDIMHAKERYYMDDHSFLLYPHVEDFIKLCATKQIPTGIVTAGLMKRLESSVPNDFLSQFKAIITSDMYERGKPEPDPYLAGAGAIGVAPHECIVVENAPFGIRAAKRAGAYCIAIASTLPKETLLEADTIVASFGDIKELPVVSTFLAD
ncbi:MAG: hypothetical protein COU47_00790 [Candidatus Niyogibacteria bacterium CG10_big_fil_rev_8_21_14_0_10_46_36]|uniref:HAD family phosphatase n=1 Tax=Candidatus Niyogibacteria bacterium CG10_big_fil_rev_8_21_14_0_10_46_36 TaxID=1974726 RepID=A0A2H0TG73_9BACT|nr:MAG: hypothetical protein COU47_00790 [Candidatus Niyogibacteria bacterium CG10_big_fil_rev_8_21_14_0_10_46_36]